ncbi:MAG: AMP-binding protein [Proteobacteria bacterium]|nr:AMP-binding protein [Pseudomonadota bacterium]MBU1737669.1 AMP-binding protein [Pseudomonadota bacterium]
MLAVVAKLTREVHAGYGNDLAVTLDSSLDRDLGLDSLSRVELFARLEKTFAVTLSEKILFTAETPRDLLRGVTSAGGVETPVAREMPSISEPVGKIDAPVHADTLNSVLRWHVAHHPDRPHIRFYSDRDDGEVLTYGELYRGALKVAAGLQQAGLEFGESVLIMLPTGQEYFCSFFGILLAGGIPAPVYPPGRAKQIEEHLLRHSAIAANCGARIMIVMPEARQFAQLMQHGVGTLKTFLTVNELADLGGSEVVEPVVASGDTAFLQYTSGSTGMPKGVILSHANLLANIRVMGSVVGVSGNDVFVSWLPLYHDMGLIGAWLGSLYFGCRLVIMSPLSFISRPVRWFRAINRYGGTLSAAPNFAYELCQRRIEEKDLKDIDLSSWRCAFNGAEAVSPTIINRFVKRFAGCGFRAESMMPVYGLAESSVGLAFPPLERGVVIDRISRKDLMEKGLAVAGEQEGDDTLEVVSCGLPLPGHQIRVADQKGRELPERRVGSIQFTGPSTTSGYFRNPEASARLFQDQWLDSGDKGYIAAGELYVTGRSKDIIIRGGRNIYPVELEEAVGGIDGIRAGNVAVFGSADKEDATERLIVLAETRVRNPEKLAGLRTGINAAVSDLVGIPPDDIVFAPPNTVLKTSSGKVRRAASRELYEMGMIGKAGNPIWLQMVRFYSRGIGRKVADFSRTAGEFFYACYCWLIFVVFASLTWTVLMVLPMEAWRAGFTRLVSRVVAKIVGIRVVVNGGEYLQSGSGPFLFVSNHASYLDAIIVGAALPLKISFLAKAELKESLFLRFALQRLGVVFVERFDREKGVADAHRLIDRIEGGRSLYFFAEGTFSRMPGLLPFRMGAFETATTSGTPVVPIAIRGTRSILRARSWLPRRGVVRVTIGEPLMPEGDGDLWGRAVQLRDLTRRWILEHCGEPDLGGERSPLANGPDR